MTPSAGSWKPLCSSLSAVGSEDLIIPPVEPIECRCSGSSVSSSSSNEIRSTAFLTSRTFPFHAYDKSSCSACGSTSLIPSYTGSCELVQEPVYEGHYVLPRLTQGRDHNVCYVKALIKVFPEITGLGGFQKVAVCGGNNSDVDVDILVSAEAVNRSLFEHAQQLDLVVQAEPADFV